jgi:hypothetical protein
MYRVLGGKSGGKREPGRPGLDGRAMLLIHFKEASCENVELDWNKVMNLQSHD